MSYLFSIFGIVALMAIAWGFSSDRRVVNWRAVGWGLGIQLLIAAFIFVLPAGAKLFMVVNDLVLEVLDCATAGTEFVFGRLAIGPGDVDAMGQPSLGYMLAFQSLPTIIFFAAIVAVLYQIGVMNWLIKGFAFLFTKLMRVSGAEALSASSNIFVGVEASLVIKPYLEKMTKSELCTVLTAGMATIASSMLAVYITMLKGQFPSIAGHLVSASIMNAPAAIIMAKLICPETGEPVTLGKSVQPIIEKEPNVFSAIINGANSGVKLIVGIVTLLLAFLGIVALVDKIFILVGSPINSVLGTSVDWSLKGLLGYIFYPITLLMGIPASEALPIAKIIGERAILTEVAAFQDLATLIQNNPSISPRTIVVTTYALTGFAHVASIAIFVGGISALVPSRLKDLSQLGFRALVAATLACLVTGCVAGLFYTNQASILFG